MKFYVIQGAGRDAVRARRPAGFTLTELMVSMTIFTLVIGGMIAGHVFGLKVFELTRSNLGAADSGQKLSSRLGADIRAAAAIKIGRGDERGFQELLPQEVQQGNAIQIYTSADTNEYLRYYVSEADRKLMLISADGSQKRMVAEGLSNAFIFSAEDSAGRVITNRQSGFVLGVNLQFSEIPGSGVAVGKGKYYDSFRWQMKFALRAYQ
jgi:prepilin-type N-terminal cleavage/methylation domain-containing protein